MIILMHIIALLYLKEYEVAKKDVENLPVNGLQEQRKLAFEVLVKICSGDVDNAFSIVNRSINRGEGYRSSKSYIKGSQ